MASYLPPKQINLKYNPGDFDYQNKFLTLSTIEPRYLKKVGSDVCNSSITFNNSCSFNSLINVIGGLNSTSNLIFYTGSVERMRVSSSNGYIGVGTTNPAYNLHVNGSINGSTIYENGVGLSSKYAQLSVDNVLSGQQTVNNNMIISGQLKLNGVIRPYYSGSANVYNMTALTADDYLVGRNTTDTLTNKTVTRGILDSCIINSNFLLDIGGSVSTTKLSYVNGLNNNTTSADIASLQSTVGNVQSVTNHIQYTSSNDYVTCLSNFSINQKNLFIGSGSYLVMDTAPNSGSYVSSSLMNFRNIPYLDVTFSLNTAISNLQTILTGCNYDGLTSYLNLANNLRVLGSINGNLVGNSNGIHTGNVLGTAAASSTIVVSNNTTDSSDFLTFTSTASGNASLFTNLNLKYNATTNSLSSTILIGNLTGNVTGTLNGFVNGTSAASNTINIANNTTDTNDFITFTNTSSGNASLQTNSNLKFNAMNGTLSTTTLNGSLIGDSTGTHIGAVNGTSAASTTVTVANNTSDTTDYIPFTSSSSGNASLLTNSNLKYNAATNNLSSSTFTGNLIGNSTGTHTGSVSGTASSANTIQLSTNSTATADRIPFTPIASGFGSLRNNANLTYSAVTNTLSSTNFTGNLIGNTTGTHTGAVNGTSTTSTTVTIANNTTDTGDYIPFTSSSNGNASLLTNANLIFNATNGTLSATTFTGNLNGVATTANNIATTAVTTGSYFIPLATTGSSVPVKINSNLSYDVANKILYANILSGTTTKVAINQNEYDNIEYTLPFSSLDATGLSISGSSSLNDSVNLTYNPIYARLTAGSINSSLSSGTNTIQGTTTFGGTTTVPNPSGSNNNEVPNTAYLTTNYAPIQSGNPSGCVITMAAVATPAGYLLCDGSSYLRAVYPTLFAVIGVQYGSTSGTTFSVPDFRGAFLRGYGANGSNANYTSGSIGTAQGDQTGSHNHSFAGANGKYYGSQSTFGKVAGSSTYLDSSGTFPAFINSNAVGSSPENRPFNYAVYYYIKT